MNLGIVVSDAGRSPRNKLSVTRLKLKTFLDLDHGFNN